MPFLRAKTFHWRGGLWMRRAHREVLPPVEVPDFERCPDREKDPQGWSVTPPLSRPSLCENVFGLAVHAHSSRSFLSFAA